MPVSIRIEKSLEDFLVLPVGRFYRDGRWRDITRADCEEMVRNFEQDVLRRIVPVNIEHERARGAVGRVARLWVEDDGVHAAVELSPHAPRNFGYVSPEIYWSWTHPYTGETHRNVLAGLALTNYPFFLGKTALWRDGSWVQAPVRFSKMHIAEITPAALRRSPRSELLSLHRRAHQLYARFFAGNRKEAADGLTREDLENVHALIVAEMERRGLRHTSPLGTLIASELWTPDTLPQEVLVVPDAVSIVGSAARGEQVEPHDLDVLFRLEVDPEDPRYFRLRRENIDLPVRNALNVPKWAFHPIDNPQGPHGPYIPLYHLVLRRVDDLSVRSPADASDGDAEPFAAGGLVLEFVGTGSPSATRRRGAALRIRYGDAVVQIDGEKPSDLDPSADAVLVTGPDAWNARAAVRAGGQVARARVEPPGLPPLTIRPHRVEPSRPSYGYEIRAGRVRVAYLPKLWSWPSWADGADLAIIDGSAWGGPSRVSGNPGGHAALSDLAAAAREAGVRRLVATHVSAQTERALKAGEPLPPGLEVAADGDRISLLVKAARTVRPGVRYPVMKPVMAGTTEFFDVAELWPWAETKLRAGHPLLGSPKIDGFRTSVHWDGSSLSVFLEDSKERRRFPAIESALSGLPPFVIEGEFTARVGRTWVARTQLAGVIAGRVDADPFFHLYDLLFLKEDVHDRPFSERLAALRSLRLPRKHFAVLPQRPVRSRRDLERVGKWAASRPLSEGLYLRQADAPYVFGPTDTAAKLKTVLELKVEVLAAERKTNGWVYRCALREPGKFRNAVDTPRGPRLVLGNTFVSKDKLASPGDTLNVRVEELVVLEGPRLAWGKPTPVGPDRSRPAYTASQAVSLARRAGLLKEEVPEEHADAPGEDEDTRGGRAARLFAENWHELLPRSGRGKFVYHHHFRGLSEEEAELDEPDLLALPRRVSIHGDLRLEGPDALWGWTVFLGKADEVRKAGGDRLSFLPPDDALQVSPKLPQPKSWLRVGVGKPLVTEPGEVGATSQKYAKFFAYDRGTYRLGVCRQHSFELFLNGKRLKGRYLVVSVPRGGRRVWQIMKPKDQTPYAESHDKEKVIEELRRKGQRWLVWSDGRSKPEWVDVRAAARHADLEEAEERIAFFVVFRPGVDADGDPLTPDEIEAAAHRFLEDYAAGLTSWDFQHAELLADDAATLVESWIQREPVTYSLSVRGEERVTEVPAGSWCIAVRVDDPALWDAILAGEVDGISPVGWADLEAAP